MALKKYPVVWTETAIQNKNDITDYLFENWSKKEIGNFYKSLDRRVELISYNPELYTLVAGTELTRKSVLHKRTIIFYEFRNNIVEILYLFNTWKDPERLPF